MEKINFITPHSRKPAGGIRVVNELCRQISKDFDSKIWPVYNSKIRSGYIGNNQTASLREAAHWVITEFQLPYLYATNDIKSCYSILVQNPYILFHLKRFKRDLILKNLQNAKYVFCISDDAVSVIKSIIPEATTVRLKWSLDEKILENRTKIENLLKTKKKIISYMPRKCRPIHRLLRNYNEINGYRLVPLNNLPFKDLIALMCSSSIFIALSEYEGFAAPPVEAYALGNIVIGYTGNGNEKLFDYENFHKIEQNNFVRLIDKVTEVTEREDNFFLNQYELLIDKFCPTNVTKFNSLQFANLNFNEQCIIFKNFTYPTTKIGSLLDSVKTKIHEI